MFVGNYEEASILAKGIKSVCDCVKVLCSYRSLYRIDRRWDCIQIKPTSISSAKLFDMPALRVFAYPDIHLDKYHRERRWLRSKRHSQARHFLYPDRIRRSAYAKQVRYEAAHAFYSRVVEVRLPDRRIEGFAAGRGQLKLVCASNNVQVFPFVLPCSNFAYTPITLLVLGETKDQFNLSSRFRYFRADYSYLPDAHGLAWQLQAANPRNQFAGLFFT